MLRPSGQRAPTALVAAGLPLSVPDGALAPFANRSSLLVFPSGPAVAGQQAPPAAEGGEKNFARRFLLPADPAGTSRTPIRCPTLRPRWHDLSASPLPATPSNGESPSMSRGITEPWRVRGDPLGWGAATTFRPYATRWSPLVRSSAGTGPPRTGLLRKKPVFPHAEANPDLAIG